jgi:hypothetical protein
MTEPRMIDTELGFPVEVLEKLELRGIHDLTRLKEREPWKVKAIVWLTAHDVPVRDICDCVGVSPVTVQLVQESPECETSAVTIKARLTARMKMVFRLGLEAKMQEAKDGKLSLFDLKLLFDMIQLSEGGATQRIEYVEDPELAELKRFLAAQQVAPAPLPMVREAEEIRQLPGLAGSQAAPLPMAPDERLTDRQSVISTHEDAENQ